jgi:hypothetical protein
VASDFHFVAGFCQELIVLWPALFGSWFFSPRPVRNNVIGHELEHRFKQGFLFARHASHGFQAGAPMTKGIDRSFETDPPQIDLMPDARFLHQ